MSIVHYQIKLPELYDEISIIQILFLTFSIPKPTISMAWQLRVHLSANLVFHDCIEKIEIDFHFVQDMVKRQLQVWINSSIQRKINLSISSPSHYLQIGFPYSETSFSYLLQKRFSLRGNVKLDNMWKSKWVVGIPWIF